MLPQSGPPSQPSMSASGPPSGPSPYAFDGARRRSLNGTPPPTLREATAPAFAKQAPSHAEHWPAPSHDPASFARPPMPPPSSPPQQQTHPSQSHRPPYTSHFGPSRELPGLGQAHRPGSSMSISSLIGGAEAGAGAQASQPQPSPPTHASQLNNHSMQPPSPRRAFQPGARSDFALFRRQPSPDRATSANTSRASDTPGFSAGSPPSRSYSAHGSPNPSRQSLPPSYQNYKPSGFPSQRLFGPSPSDPLARDVRQPPGGIPPRPNSQPNGPPGSTEREGASHDAPGGRRGAYGQTEERRRTLGEQSRPDAAELLRGIGQGATDRNRPVTVHPVSQSVFNPPREQQGATGSNEPSRSLWRPPPPSEPLREVAETQRDEPSGAYRSYGTYPPPAPGPPRYGPPTLSEMAPRRSLDQLSNRIVEQYHAAAPTSDPKSKERHQTEPLARSFSSGGHPYLGRSMYGEPMQHSKSHIGLGLEESRRTGRASPLPQAVQGAQAPPFMTGKDPGIKSEFGRMFSGLGGLGSSTPLRGSPLPQNLQDGQEPGELMRRISSQQGRKPKRVKDESNVFDDDSNDGRGTPTGVRGAKRNKHAHSHHHHAQHHQ